VEMGAVFAIDRTLSLCGVGWDRVIQFLVADGSLSLIVSRIFF